MTELGLRVTALRVRSEVAVRAIVVKWRLWFRGLRSGLRLAVCGGTRVRVGNVLRSANGDGVVVGRLFGK